MDATKQLECKNNKSLEKFEVNENFLKISEQIKTEVQGKTLDETIDYLVKKVDGSTLFSKRFIPFIVDCIFYKILS